MAITKIVATIRISVNHPEGSSVDKHRALQLLSDVVFNQAAAEDTGSSRVVAIESRHDRVWRDPSMKPTPVIRDRQRKNR